MIAVKPANLLSDGLRFKDAVKFNQRKNLAVKVAYPTSAAVGPSPHSTCAVD
jgi:hypothetical protein